MHHLGRKLTAWFIFMSLLAPQGMAFGIGSSEFNPNYLLSDADLQNYASMNQNDIQAFLDSYGGYIAKYRTTDTDGVERGTAEMIYRAAELYRINPKYLLVKLQKEQSLVTDPSPTQKQLDWATGYGVCDGCSMDDPKIQKHKGFATQIDSAAGIMRWYYDNPGNGLVKKINATYIFDTITVIPSTLATAFLYTYTPHINGNRNFWKLWQKWFDQIYPDGTLLKSEGSPVVYVLVNKKKRAFTSLTALVTRYDPKLIVTAPESELSRYETGKPITLPNYSVVTLNNNYYLVDNQTLRPFASAEVVRQLGYNPDEFVAITSEDMLNYDTGTAIGTGASAPLGRLVRVKENKQLYYLKENAIRPILDEQIAKNNFPNLAIENVGIAELGGPELGDAVLFKDGTLIGQRGSRDVYVIENGIKRHIPSEEVLTALGYKRSNVVWTDELTLLRHRTGAIVNRRVEPVASDTDGENNPGTVPIPENMVVTLPANTTTTGPVFATQVNTYLVADAKTGKILASKNMDDARPLASFTKVMTGYRLFQEKVPLKKVTTFKAKYKSKYDKFRATAGEKFRNDDLMASLLVSSLNTPANMLVANVDVNPSSFVKRMNTQAKKWGLKKTTFVDPAGVEVDNKSTAREFLSLYRKAIEDKQLAEFLGAGSYSYDEALDLDKKPRHYDTSSNKLVGRDDLPFRIRASKTAYLEEAGAGLVMTIERPSDKKRFIIITMGNPDYNNRFDEPERLAKWVIQTF